MTKLKNYGIITGDTLNTSFGYDEENNKCKKLKELLLNLFLEKKGTYYSTCQAGLGLYCAEAALKTSNQLFCVIPYENQPQKWTSDFRERYFMLHEFAYDVKTISVNYSEDCYKDADKFIIKNCDEIILVISEGEEIPDTVKTAMESSKSVTIINCDDLTIKVNNI